MEKEKSRAIVMSLAGIYLIYLGVDLVSDVLADQPDNMILFIVLGVIFVVVGIGVVVQKARTVMRIQQEEARIAQEEIENEEAENDAFVEEDILKAEEIEKVEIEIEDTDTDAFEREVERMLDEKE